MRNIREINPACFTILLACIACIAAGSGLTGGTAFGQVDVERLSDAALVEQLHRGDYKEEFDRRMRAYSPKRRLELAEMRAKMPRQRSFPQDYTDDELLEQACRMQEAMAATKALEELRVRYADADEQKVAVMEGKLRAAFASAGYLEPTPARLNDPAYHEASDALHGLSKAVAACLPEEKALKLLWDIHIEPKPHGGINRFLSHLGGKPFTGQATVDTLSALRQRLKTEYTNESLAAAGESPWMTGLTYLLAQCGQPGLEALKELDWDSPIGIQTMGVIGTEESQRLLLELYAATPAEHLDKRLDIIRAVSNNVRSEADAHLRDFVREELSGILANASFDRLFPLSSAVQIAGNTRDPHFLEPLQEFGRQFRLARIEPKPYETEEMLARSRKSLGEHLEVAIDRLRKAAEKAAE